MFLLLGAIGIRIEKLPQIRQAGLQLAREISAGVQEESAVLNVPRSAAMPLSVTDSIDNLSYFYTEVKKSISPLAKRVSARHPPSTIPGRYQRQLLRVPPIHSLIKYANGISSTLSIILSYFNRGVNHSH